MRLIWERGKPRPGVLFPWVVLIISLAATYVASWFVSTTIYEKDESRFHATAEQTQVAISNKLETYTALLQGVTGMFSQDHDVNHDEFKDYVDALHLERSFPGALGLGYSLFVVDRGLLNTRLKNEHIDPFTIWPSVKPEPHAILYIFPETPENKAAVGFNMFTEPVRRAAMEEARDTGKPVASGRVILVQTKSPGFVIYVPVYYGGRGSTVAAQNRERLLGFVYSPFDANQLFRTIVSGTAFNMARVKIYTDPHGKQLLYDSAREDSRRQSAHPKFVTSIPLEVNGKRWLVSFTSTPAFEKDSEALLVPFTALVGLIFSSLLFFFTFMESSARQGAQQEVIDRKKAQRELAFSERRLRNLIQQAPLSIQVLSPDGRITEVNHGFEALWGVSRDAVKDTNAFESKLFKDTGLVPFLRHAAMGESAFMPPAQINTRSEDGEEQIRWIAGSAYPVKDDEGRIREIVVVHQDLTDVKKAEEEVRRMNSELEQRVFERTKELGTAMAEMEAFSYSVAHDLRAPLRAMGSFAKILMEDHSANLDEEAHNYLTRIVENSIRMGELIDGLLDLARISRTTLEHNQVDLSLMAEEIVRNLEKRNPRSGVRVSIQPGLRVEADSRLIQSAMENLLDNAFKFTQNTMRPIISFGSEMRPSGPVYFVRDNGAGFDPAYVNKLFKPFERLHTGEEFPGTGIGLATVRRIIERHGGRVWAEGSLHEGATFYFTIAQPLPKQPFHVSEGPTPPAATSQGKTWLSASLGRRA